MKMALACCTGFEIKDFVLISKRTKLNQDFLLSFKRFPNLIKHTMRLKLCNIFELSYSHTGKTSQKNER